MNGIDAGSYERQLRDGRTFILDAPTTIPALWGSGTDVLWAAGEPLMVTGPQGTGKSGTVQQLVLARQGIGAPEFLGYPVEPTSGTALYIAADRPRQIARSFRRMVSEEYGELLEERLRVWEGPLPFDVVKEPHRLAEFAQTLGVTTVYVDSLKDIAWPLSSDEVGAAVNRATGGVIAAGIEIALVHHGRKATAENRKPTSLADVYGSVWITSNVGSVLGLWGEPGDPVVELLHLKQPADDVGPLELEHDHDRGVTRRREREDAWSVLQASKDGVTAADAATAIYGHKPTRAQVEKARRRLERFAEDGLAKPIKGPLKTDPVVYRKNSGVKLREGSREVSREPHATSRTPGNTDHGGYTQPDSSAPS